jgi:hypothetical protein
MSDSCSAVLSSLAIGSSPNNSIGPNVMLALVSTSHESNCAVTLISYLNSARLLPLTSRVFAANRRAEFTSAGVVRLPRAA